MHLAGRFLLAAFLAILCAATPSTGTILTVRPDGGGTYPTIQAAIDHAVNGDIIQLTNGVFSGSGNRDLDYVGRTVTIRSQSGNPDSCSIDCGGSATNPHRGFYFHSHEGSGAVLQGVSVRQGWHDYGSAVRCENSSTPIIRNCVFRNNQGGSAIYLDSSPALITGCRFTFNSSPLDGGALFFNGMASSSWTIENSVFEDNSSGSGGGGMAISALVYMVVTGCRFARNQAVSYGGAVRIESPDYQRFRDCLFDGNSAGGAGGGIFTGLDAYAEVSRCTFSGNSSDQPGSAVAGIANSGMYLENCILAWSPKGRPAGCNSGISLSCSDVYGNRDGDWVGCIAGQGSQYNNFSANPLFCDPGSGDYSLSQSSPCAPLNNPACGRVGAFDIGCTLQTLIVRSDGTGDYPNIQSAVDAAGGAAIIRLEGALFSGTGNRDIILHGKPLLIQSVSGNPDSCAIDCGGAGSDHRGFLMVNGEGPSTTIEGITIQNGHSSGNGGGIYCDGSSPWIRYCRIAGCAADGAGGGIYTSAPSAARLDYCILTDNSAGVGGGAAAAADSANLVLDHSTLVANHAPIGGGLYVSGPASLTVSNSIVAFCPGGEAVRCDSGGAAAVSCTDLWENAGGDWVGCVAGQQGISGNLNLDPLFCGLERRDLYLQNHSPCVQDGSCGGVGAFPVGCGGVLTVRPDGSGSYPTIQSALFAAIEGDFIELENGIYQGSGNRDLVFQGRNVTLRSKSGNPELCTIDCQGRLSDPHRAISIHIGETDETVIDGITFTNGCILGEDSYPFNCCGGAIRCLRYEHPGGASPTYPVIRNCRFLGNHSELRGGAVFTWGSSPGPRIENCTFQDNSAGVGGAVAAAEGDVAIVGSTFVGNSAEEGGAFGSIQTDHFRIERCTFAGNSASLGGAIANESWGFFGGGEVTNTIVAFGTAGAAIVGDLSFLDLQCTDLFANPGGDWIGELAAHLGVDGNIDQDPLFCNELNPEEPLTLSGLSPCAPESDPDCAGIGAWPVGCDIGASVESAGQAREGIQLGPPAPNPLVGETTISFLAPRSAKADLRIYDVSGRCVRTLIEESIPAGARSIAWNGRNDLGRPVPSGVYFVRLAANGESRSRMLVVAW